MGHKETDLFVGSIGFLLSQGSQWVIAHIVKPVYQAAAIPNVELLQQTVMLESRFKLRKECAMSADLS